MAKTIAISLVIVILALTTITLLHFIACSDNHHHHHHHANDDGAQTQYVKVAVAETELAPPLSNYLFDGVPNSDPNRKVEFPVTATKESAARYMKKALDLFEQEMIRPAYEQGAKLIVFPEYALYGPVFSDRQNILPYLEYVPNRGQFGVVKPCDVYREDDVDHVVLRTVSCLARRYNMYIVLNMGDVQPCDRSRDGHCPLDGRYQYNTQVALSPDGTLLTKYHKSNLYNEANIFNAGDGIPVYFDTPELGRVGLFICFDLLFEKPTLDLIYRYNITMAAFSTWWVNYPPLLNGLQTQQGMSYKHQFTLLAASSGQGYKSSGSGIHVKGNTIASAYAPDRKKMSLLVGSVPVTPKKAPLERRQKEKQTEKQTEEHKEEHKEKENRPAVLLADQPKVSEQQEQQQQQVEKTKQEESTTTIKVGGPPLVSLEPFLLTPSRSYHFKVTAGDVKCDVQFTSSSKQFEDDSLFMVVAASGYVWPTFPCDVCGVMRCGSSYPEHCYRVMNLTSSNLSTSGFIEDLRINMQLSPLSTTTAFPMMMTSEGLNLVDDLNQLNIRHQGLSYEMSVRSVHRPTLSAVVFGVHKR